MNAPEDALIAKAAEALWDSLLGKYKRGEFTECPEQHLPWWHDAFKDALGGALLPALHRIATTLAKLARTMEDQ